MKIIKALFCKNNQFAYTIKFMVFRSTGGFSPIDDKLILLIVSLGWPIFLSRGVI